MAKLRIFVSSTFYDLRYLRSTLERFITDLGHEPILSERGAVHFDPSKTLAESCFDEVSRSDVFVLIIGGRYGTLAPATGIQERQSSPSLDRTQAASSITKLEHSTALELGIPIYTLIERNVYVEYLTYTRNNSSNICYAHVDDVRVFEFIDSLMNLPLNNPIHPFDRESEIEDWLKSQWSSLLKQLLASRAKAAQFDLLSHEVSRLSDTAATLERYVERLLQASPEIAPIQASDLIDSEKARRAALAIERAEDSSIVEYIRCVTTLPTDAIVRVIRGASTFKECIVRLAYLAVQYGGWENNEAATLTQHLRKYNILHRVNEIRIDLDLQPFEDGSVRNLDVEAELEVLSQIGGIPF